MSANERPIRCSPRSPCGPSPPSSPSSRTSPTTRGSGLWGTVYDDGDEDALFDAYRDALTLKFNARYGTDANDLAAWQALCERIGIDVPDTLEECREEVTNTHVNLIDLVHVHGTDHTVERFASVHELSEYTISSKKYFPRENAHAGNLLKYLLRHIFNPEKNNIYCQGGMKERKGGKKGRGGRWGRR